MQLDPQKQKMGGELAFFASQGFAWEGLPNQPGIHTLCWPVLCFGGPTESTWNPLRPLISHTCNGGGKGAMLADGHPIQCYVGGLG